MFGLTAGALLLVLSVTKLGTPLAVAGLHAYQATLSPLIARVGVQCRFTLSCSRYAEIVIERDGVVVGGWQTVKRLARCGPWTPPGTRDDP